MFLAMKYFEFHLPTWSNLVDILLVQWKTLRTFNCLIFIVLGTITILYNTHTKHI